MKKYALLTIIVFYLLPIAHANPMISQVLYDPLGTESGGEAIELYNPTNQTINISLFTIMTESSATDITIPQHTSLPPQSHYLIADTNWNTAKDDPSYPDADHEEALTMYNSDSGIALLDQNNTILDAVGWGDPVNIDPLLFETAPALDVSAGNVLKRTTTVDSDNNLADFAESAPLLKNSDYQESVPSSLNLNINISSSPPSLSNLQFPDDTPNPNKELIPYPGEIRTISFNITVDDPDGLTNINITATITDMGTLPMTLLTNLSPTSAIYSADLLLNYDTPPDTYQLSIIATDSKTNTTLNSPFAILELLAISLDAVSLDFPSPTAGQESIVLGDESSTTNSAPTITNTGNTPVNIGLNSPGLTSQNHSIDPTNLRFSLDQDFNSPLAGTLSLQTTTAQLNLIPGALSSLSFALFIPPQTVDGIYIGSVNVVAIGG